jgi:acetamidase/formamidase
MNKSMDMASMGMIKLLQDKKGLSRLDAYGLASAAMDCRVGAVSDANKAVHCVMPKNMWVAK